MTNRQLKAAVARAQAGRVRPRYPLELKSALRSYAETRRAEGATWSQVGVEVGLDDKQLSRLCGRVRIRRVAIVADAPATGSLTLTLPGGSEVVGLDVPTLAALLKALS